MMSFLPIFEKMVELFLIVLIGYVATRLGVLNQDIKKAMTRLVLNISLPCTILSSVIGAKHLPTRPAIASLMLVAFLSYVPLIAIGYFIPWLLRMKHEKKAAATFALIFGNIGFIGFPVTQAIYGVDALFYTCVFNLPFNFICLSFGAEILRRGNGEKSEKGSFRLRSVINSSVVASIVAVGFAFAQIKVPALLVDTTATVGNITTPVALLIIGATLAQMKVSEMFGNVYAYVITAVNILISPAITYALFHPFLTDPMALRIAVIMDAMPVATTGTMLCVDLGGDEKFMAQMTFISTAATVFTIPIIAMLLA